MGIEGRLRALETMVAPKEPVTERQRFGLVTRGRSRVQWARITSGGKVHHIQGVIIRWDFRGGTREKPDVTFMASCGPQKHAILPAPDHALIERCVRCENLYGRLYPKSS